jgi:hypothetical protein
MGMYMGKNYRNEKTSRGKELEESGVAHNPVCQRRDLEKLGRGIGRSENEIGRVIYLPWPLLTKEGWSVAGGQRKNSFRS